MLLDESAWNRTLGQSDHVSTSRQDGNATFPGTQTRVSVGRWLVPEASGAALINLCPVTQANGQPAAAASLATLVCQRRWTRAARWEPLTTTFQPTRQLSTLQFGL